MSVGPIGNIRVLKFPIFKPCLHHRIYVPSCLGIESMVKKIFLGVTNRSCKEISCSVGDIWFSRLSCSSKLIK